MYSNYGNVTKCEDIPIQAPGADIVVPASLPPEMYMTFGSDNPIARPCQPFELAPAYLYLASDDSSYARGDNPSCQWGRVFSSLITIIETV